MNDRDGERLDVYLASRLPEVSRSRLQQLIREQLIVVNGRPAKPRDAVRIGDCVHISLPEAVPDELLPQAIPLDVLYEDEELLVVNKAPGMVVHPAPGNPDGTLVNALLHHCGGKLSSIGGEQRPGIVHRLDKDTSGCLVVAKTNLAYESLVAQFAQRLTMEKIYLAVTEGTPSPAVDTVFTHIGRHPVSRQKMAVVNPPGGKTAITDYQVVFTEPESRTSLVRCHLHTGRTHQIRVHLHYKTTPIVGDPIYGKSQKRSDLPDRLMLHAWVLAFHHPVTRSQLRIEAPIPKEFDRWFAGSSSIAEGS